MNKIITYIRSAIIIIAMLAFFATPISFFTYRDFALLFFGIFWILIALVLLLKGNEWKMGIVKKILIIIVMIVIGGFGLYGFILDQRTHTVFTISLKETAPETFVGEFSVPSVPLSTKPHTFFIDMTYLSKTASPTYPNGPTIEVTFKTPTETYLKKLNMIQQPSKERRNTIGMVTNVLRPEYNFIPVDGNYTITISRVPDNSWAELRSATIRIREYR